MKKISIMFLFLLIFGFTVSNTVTGFAVKSIYKVSFENAEVTVNVANIRTGPSTKEKIVCMLKKGDRIEVLGKLGDWYAIYHSKNKCIGMIHSKLIKPIYPSSKVPLKSSQSKSMKKPSPVRTSIPKPSPVTTSSQSVQASTEEKALLVLINQARTQAGVKALTFDSGVLKTARLKARDMVDKNYFAHQSPTYGSPFDMMRQFGVSFKSAGENIAGNQTYEKAFNAWMNSPGHKQNILNASFTATGIGITDSPVYGKVFVQQFIGR